MTSADIVPFLKKHPLSVSCVAVALICAGTLYFRSDIGPAMQAELEAKSAEAKKMEGNVRNSANLAQQVAEIQEQRKDLENRLLKVGQLAVNLQYFYKLEADTGVKLIDVRQNTAGRPKGLYVGIPFSVTVQGTYPQVMNFLARVEGGRHFCHVVTSSFSKIGSPTEPASSTTPDMSLSLNIELLGQP